MRRVDVHLEARVGLEQRLVPGRELVRVLRHVVGGDGEEHRVIGERIGVVHPGLVACRRRRDTALPGRDGAVGIAGLLGSQGSQVGTEPSDLLRRQLRPASIVAEPTTIASAQQKRISEFLCMVMPSFP